MSGISIEEIEAYPGTTRIDRPIIAGDTSIRLRTSPHLSLLHRWVAIEVGSGQCEIRQITGIENRDITVNAALGYSHPQNAILKYLENLELDVILFGADPTETLNSAAAFNAAHVQAAACSPDASVKFSGNFIIESTISYLAPMRGSGMLLSTLRSTINTGGSVIEIDNLDTWELSGFQIDGQNNSCVGILAINTSSWYKIEDVRITACATGAQLDGWGGEIARLQAVSNDGNGIELSHCNGARVNFLAESNGGIGFTLETSSGIQLDSCLFEGNTLGGGTIDNCFGVTLNSPYSESNIVFALKVGYTTLVTGFTINGGSFSNDNNGNDGGIFLDKVLGGSINLYNLQDTSYRLIYMTSNCQKVDVNIQRTAYGHIQDDSKGLKTIYNYFPNANFQHWLGGWKEIYTGGHITISQETTLCRTGNSALKVQANAGFYDSVAIGLPDDLVAYLAGRTLVFGAWVYIPTIAEFTGDNYPWLYIGDDAGGSALYTHNYVRTGCWSFLYSNYSVLTVGGSPSWVRLVIRPTRTSAPGEITGNEYIIVDSVVIADSVARLADLVNGRYQPHPLAGQNFGNNLVMYGAAAPTSSTMVFKVGDRVYDVAPAAGGTLGWVCTAAGSPGTWKAFGSIAA